VTNFRKERGCLLVVSVVSNPTDENFSNELGFFGVSQEEDVSRPKVENFRKELGFLGLVSASQDGGAEFVCLRDPCRFGGKDEEKDSKELVLVRDPRRWGGEAAGCVDRLCWGESRRGGRGTKLKELRRATFLMVRVVVSMA
jgi:hypothetical protein